MMKTINSYHFHVVTVTSSNADTMTNCNLICISAIYFVVIAIEYTTLSILLFDVSCFMLLLVFVCCYML